MTNKIVQIRKACEAVEMFKKAHILFVPVPVLNEADHLNLVQDAAQRLEKLQGGQQ